MPSHAIVNLQTAMALTGASDEAVRWLLPRRTDDASLCKAVRSGSPQRTQADDGGRYR